MLPPANTERRVESVGGIEFNLDHNGEFDELWLENAFVHIERMTDTGFWFGIEQPGKPRLMINTGVHNGIWYFNMYEDSANNPLSFQVQRPRRSKLVKPAKPANAPDAAIKRAPEAK